MARRPHALSRPSEGQITIGAVMGVIALVAFEVGWLRWALVEPLPNAGNVGGGGLSRSWFLWRALPEVVPGLKFSESYLGMALKELVHVENLTQRLPIVLAAALIVGALLSMGSLILRALRLAGELSPAEWLGSAFGLGAGALGALTMVAGRFGTLTPWSVRVGLGVVVVSEIGYRFATGSVKRISIDGKSLAAFLAITGPFLILMALGAMLPTIDFDCLEYHLQGPKEYYQNGRITFLPHNVYTSMPFGVEMLHLLGMEVLDDWWLGAMSGQLLVMLHAPAAALMIYLAARRWASPRAAWFASVVYLTTPWVYRLGVIPYVEGPLCYYHAALIWAAGRAWTEGNPRLWGVVGGLAGGAMACKYPALLSAVVPFGGMAILTAWKRKSWPIAVAFGLGCAVIIAPWLFKNMIDTGNPIYPLGYRVFGGREWSMAADAKWSAVHGPRAITGKALGDGILDVLGRSDWQSPLFTALAPLAFLRKGSKRFATWIGLYIVYLFATWWLLTHRLDRFWLPLLPAAAILAGIGADWSRSLAWKSILAAVMTLAILANLAYSTTALTGLNRWTSDLDTLRDEVPTFTDPALAWLDAELPTGAKVMLVGQASVFHMRHPIVYNTVFDEETIETIARGRTPREIRRALAEMGVSHVYVDWFEVDRYRKPGNYGFTPFVTPDLFERLVQSGVLEPPRRVELPLVEARQEVYRVRTD